MNLLTSFEKGKIQVGDFSIAPIRGSVDVRALRKKVGYVFQQFNLWPHKNVLDNLITAPMIAGRVGRAEAIERANAPILEAILISGTLSESVR